MSFGPSLKWINNKEYKIAKGNFFYLFISIFISILIINLSEIKYLFSTILFTAGFFLFFKTIENFYYKEKNFSQNVSHFAFSLFILSILLNGIFSTEISSNMRPGDQVKFNNSYIKFIKIEKFNKKNYKSLVANFEIKKESESKVNLFPEVRIYNQPEILTSEADIKSNFFEDKFLVINILDDDGYFNVRYQVKPFMMWIWVSVVLLAYGGLLSFLRKL